MGQRTAIAALIAIAVVAAACSGDGADPTTTAAPSTTIATTTTSFPLPSDCTEGVAAVGGPGIARFDIVPDADILGCYEASSFRSRVAYRGTPLDDANPLTGDIEVLSEQALVDGDLRVRTVTTTATEVYETITVGGATTLADGSPIVGAIPDEVIQAQAIIGTTVSGVIFELGVLAAPVGDEEMFGIPVTHYVADPEAIAQFFEEAIARSGGADVDLELPGTHLEIWADPRGYTVKAVFVYDYDAALANGLPARDVALGTTTVAAVLPTGKGEMRYELFDFNAPIDIAPPS